MARSDDVYVLPGSLPTPVDDRACAHLTGLRLPAVALPSTEGREVDLVAHTGKSIIYCYPRTGRPDVEPPPGWNEIPGARGCTPESCAFRDHAAELRALGARVFGLSTQTTEYQRDAAERLHLPFELLSDATLTLTGRLRLPTFEVAGMTLIKRLTLVVRDGVIAKVFHPVFPPDRHPEEIVTWLRKATPGA
jgi:peroxiredoxin